jgi:hypothetical protein
MRCLVTAGKHVNNTRAISRQLQGKQVPAAKDTHASIKQRGYTTRFSASVEVLLDYNNGNGVFYVVGVEML